MVSVRQIILILAFKIPVPPLPPAMLNRDVKSEKSCELFLLTLQMHAVTSSRRHVGSTVQIGQMCRIPFFD